MCRRHVPNACIMECMTVLLRCRCRAPAQLCRRGRTACVSQGWGECACWPVCAVAASQRHSAVSHTVHTVTSQRKVDRNVQLSVRQIISVAGAGCKPAGMVYRQSIKRLMLVYTLLSETLYCSTFTLAKGFQKLDSLAFSAHVCSRAQLLLGQQLKVSSAMFPKGNGVPMRRTPVFHQCCEATGQRQTVCCRDLLPAANARLAPCLFRWIALE